MTQVESAPSHDPRDKQEEGACGRATIRTRCQNAREAPSGFAETFAEFYKEHYGEALPQASVRSFATQWLASRKRRRPPSRIGFTHSQSRSSSRFSGRKRRRPRKVTRSQVASFRDAQLAVSARDHESHAQGRQDDVSLGKAGWVLSKTWPRASSGEGERDLRAPCVHHRRSAADLDVATDEWRSLVLFGLYTGQRLGDIVALTWSQSTSNATRFG